MGAAWGLRGGCVGAEWGVAGGVFGLGGGCVGGARGRQGGSKGAPKGLHAAQWGQCGPAMGGACGWREGCTMRMRVASGCAGWALGL